MFKPGIVIAYGYNYASAIARAKDWTIHSGLNWTVEFHRSPYLGEVWMTVLRGD